MTRLQIEYPERALDINLGNIEIVVDPSRPGKVELYMLDSLGNRMEGGDFELGPFMDHVLEFYNKEY
jgi:hypothetical protein